MMNRSAIFVTLMAATFWGPLSCCCAWSKFVETISPSFATVEACPAGENEVVGCPFCKHSPDDTEGFKSHHGDHPSPPVCPCCEARVNDSPALEQMQLPFKFDQAISYTLPVTIDQFVCVLESSLKLHADSLNDRQTFLVDFCHRMRC